MAVQVKQQGEVHASMGVDLMFCGKTGVTHGLQIT